MSVTRLRSGECPLHIAMREAAGTAVLQHVLYLEGECLPRPELVETLEAWTRLHRLITERICPASRRRPLDPSQLPAMLEETLSGCLPPVPAQLPAQVLQLLQQCVACTPASGCPLDMQPDGDLGVSLHQ
jgi:hypothetical protein